LPSGWFGAPPQWAVGLSNKLQGLDKSGTRTAGFDSEGVIPDRPFYRGADDDIAGLLAPQQPDAAGVHQRVGAAMPLGLHTYAVARHARLVVHDRDAFFHSAVKQRGFADIGAADDGDESCCGVFTPLFTPGKQDTLGYGRSCPRN